MALKDVIPNNLRALEERVKRQQERVSELRRSGQDAKNATIVLDVMTESLVRLVELHEKNSGGNDASSREANGLEAVPAGMK